MSGSFRSIVIQNAVLVVAITTRIHLIPDRSAKTSRMAVSYAIARRTVTRYSLLYIPELWWGSRDPFVSFTSGKSINVRLSLLPISPLPLIRLNNSEDSLLTPSIRQTRSTSGSGFLHRKPKSERRSRSTCSHQAGRGIDLDLGRRGGRHRRPSTTIVERPNQNSTAKVNQGGFKNKGSISAIGKGPI
jgi:hypothetical protein